jgi:hypothetical protein
VADILKYCEGLEAVSCKSILANALSIPSERRGQKESRRVASILRASGYQREGQFTSGEDKGSSRFVRSGNREGKTGR